MGSAACLVYCCLLLAAEPIETRFVQVAPAQEVAAVLGEGLLTPPKRTPDQQRAVVLLHGLRVQPFSSRKVRQADFQLWQAPQSRLVTALAAHADVYAFSYSQNECLEVIGAHPALREHVQALKAAGYQEIVLVGHSAGGLIARQLVEDHPDSGVTKVIQVCSPNGGSTLGKLKLGVCACQESFLDSLTKEGRRTSLAQRQDRRIPEQVEFVCIVGQMNVDWEADFGSLCGDGTDLRLTYAGVVCGDGVLSVESQWPADLQQQGIPAQPLQTAHFTAMFTGSCRASAGGADRRAATSLDHRRSRRRPACDAHGRARIHAVGSIRCNGPWCWLGSSRLCGCGQRLRRAAGRQTAQRPAGDDGDGVRRRCGTGDPPHGRRQSAGHLQFHAADLRAR